MEKIVILNFSHRTKGNCASAAAFIAEYYKQTNVRIYQLPDIRPCGRCDYECLKPGMVCPDLPESYRQIMDAILNSELVFFVLPNFCGFPNGTYFAFNEHSVGYFAMDEALLKKYLAVRKRFIVISNAEGHGFIEALQQQTDRDPEILYLRSSSYGCRSIDGDLLSAEAARRDLEAFLRADGL